MRSDKIIVFDVDDILWPLNRKMAKIANVEYEKITTYDIRTNPNFTDAEKRKISEVYQSEELFRSINWYNGIERINDINADVRINSNTFSRETADLKIAQLKEVLQLSDDKIQVNLVTSVHHYKTIDSNVYIFVDDSPINIAASNAQHNIMLARPWNLSERTSNQFASLRGDLIICESLNEIIDEINRRLV